MSTNPAPRAGFTKTGKSLKAVRRYYALMNQNKQRSPDEDKLSKRIAAELKTQQDANEKRSKREGGGTVPLTDQPTERSDLPSGVILSPKDTGPVFVVPTAPSAPMVENVKSIKSTNNALLKSVKSNKSLRGIEGQQATGCCPQKLIYFLLGIMVGIALGVLLYYGMSFFKFKREQFDWSPSPPPDYITRPAVFRGRTINT